MGGASARRHALAAWLAGIAVCLAVTTSRADTTAEKKAEAEIIFREAVKLRDQGRLEEACAKFKQAFDDDEHAVGAMLNVALCDEKLGRVASAYRGFTEARKHAKSQGLTEHQKAAEDHLATLEPQVPYLRLTFAEVLPDTKVLVDDKVVDQAVEIPLDPGSRTLLVTSPGRLPYQTKVELRLGEHHAFTVPRLARSVTVKSSRRTIGKIVTFSGVAAIAIGVGVGLYANALWHDQIDAINPASGVPFCTKISSDNYNCPEAQHQKTDRARLIGNFGTAFGGLGLVAVGVGAYLWLRAPAEHAPGPGLSVVPVVVPDTIGLAAIGRF